MAEWDSDTLSGPQRSAA